MQTFVQDLSVLWRRCSPLQGGMKVLWVWLEQIPSLLFAGASCVFWCILQLIEDNKGKLDSYNFFSTLAFTLCSRPRLPVEWQWDVQHAPSMTIPFSKRSPKGHCSKIGWKYGNVMQMFYAKIFFSFIVLYGNIFFKVMHHTFQKRYLDREKTWTIVVVVETLGKQNMIFYVY